MSRLEIIFLLILLINMKALLNPCTSLNNNCLNVVALEHCACVVYMCVCLFLLLMLFIADVVIISKQHISILKIKTKLAQTPK